MLSGNKLENELTLGDWMKVLTSFKENGGEFVTFSGGEPLMFKNFPQIISHVHDLGLKSTVLSNGLLWSDKLIHEFLSRHIGYVFLWKSLLNTPCNRMHKMSLSKTNTTI